jgi:transcriptional regulator with XRE-family HTH domain
MYNRYKKLLEEKGLNNYKISNATGISQTTLSDWKRGRCTPKIDTLIKIADYLSVSLDHLCGRNEMQEKAKPFEFGQSVFYVGIYQGLPHISAWRYVGTSEGLNLFTQPSCLTDFISDACVALDNSERIFTNKNDLAEFMARLKNEEQ